MAPWPSNIESFHWKASPGRKVRELKSVMFCRFDQAFRMDRTGIIRQAMAGGLAAAAFEDA
jgi:UDP-N-acetylmuramyl tripeptide synthase